MIIPVCFVIIFFVRESIGSNIRICLASHKVVLAARMSGKIKAVAQASAQIILVVLHLSFTGNTLEYAQLLVIWSAVLITAFSLFDYGNSFYQIVKEKQSVLG